MATLTNKGYTYASILKDAAKVNWQIQDLISDGKSLDFTKPFLPEQLVHTGSITCLSTAERLLHIEMSRYGCDRNGY